MGYDVTVEDVMPAILQSDRPTPEEFIFQVAMMLDKNGSLH